MKEIGDRYNNGKAEWGLVDWEVVEDMVRVLEFGKKKYDSWNWFKGLYYVQIIESLLRHTFAILMGENKDSDSGLPHYAHIMCNAMFLGRMMKSRPDLDDRHFKQKNEMDTLTKKLVDKSAAYNAAFEELYLKDNTITTAEYIDDKDITGTFVRAYVENLGFSNKYYYE